MPPQAGQSLNAGENLKRNRMLKGMKLEELCAGICSVSQLSKIENGKAQVRDEQLYRFAERLGMSVEMLRATDSYLDRLREQMMIAERASAARQNERALEMTRAVIEQARANGYVDLYVEATFYAARLNRKLMRWEESFALLNGLLESELQLELLCRGEIWSELGHAMLHGGNKSEALRCFVQADELMSDCPLGHPRELMIYYQHSIVLYELRDYRESYHYAREANRVAKKQSKHIWRMRARTLMALNLFFMGDREQSYTLLTANLHEAEENQMVAQVGGSCINLGYLHKIAGDLIQARTNLERGVTHLELVQDQYLYLSILPYLELADVSVQVGQEARALYWLERAGEWTSTMGASTCFFESLAQRIRAKIHIRQKQPEQALACLREALARYERHNAFWEGYETAVEIADLLESRNDPEAVEMYRRALHLYTRYKEAVGWGEETCTSLSGKI